LNSNYVTEDGISSLSERNRRDLSTQENGICPQSPIHEQSQLVNDVRPQSLVSEHAVSPYVQGPTPQRDSGNDSLHLRVPYLLEKG